MRSKLIIGAFILILLSIMNTYSRALRHINMKDVKEKHQQKLIEQKIQEEKKKEEEKYIASVMEEKKYNWRKELNEQMTTSDVFSYNLPAVGDVDLNYPGLVSGGGHNSTISGDTVTISGDPSPLLSNGIILRFDSSQYDTLKFNVNMPSGNYLGFFLGANNPLVSPDLLVSSSGTYTLTVPQSKNLSIIIDTPDNATMTLSSFSFQRRTPLNVFVSLDSPEATSFVRTGSGDLSPQEKQKRLKNMLEASDEYVQQMYGDEFPGTGAVPPGEAGDTPGVEISQAQPIEPAQQRRGTTGIGVPDTKELPGPRPPMPGKMNYPPEWTKFKNA